MDWLLVKGRLDSAQSDRGVSEGVEDGSRHIGAMEDVGASTETWGVGKGSKEGISGIGSKNMPKSSVVIGRKDAANVSSGESSGTGKLFEKSLDMLAPVAGGINAAAFAAISIAV